MGVVRPKTLWKTCGKPCGKLVERKIKNLSFLFSPGFPQPILGLFPRFSTSFPQVFPRFSTAYPFFSMFRSLFLFIVSAVLLLTNLTVSALPGTFDPGLVMTDQDLYSLPLAYSSPQRIQAYLESTGSFLATYRAPVGFIDAGANNPAETDDLLLDLIFADVPERFYPRRTVQEPFGGQTMLVSELIWRLTRTSFGNSCLIDYSRSPYRATTDICIDNETRPINPGLMIALIQKESGFIYGACARTDAENASYCQSNQFRLDRLTGYACFENPDPAKTCFDENPSWKYHKGVFLQLYKATRLLRIREKSCQLGGRFAFRGGGNTYQVGNTVTVSDQQIVLKNGITCAMYIYTPHVSAQLLTYNLLRQFQIDRNYIEVRGIDPNYRPSPLRPTL